MNMLQLKANYKNKVQGGKRMTQPNIHVSKQNHAKSCGTHRPSRRLERVNEPGKKVKNH